MSTNPQDISALIARVEEATGPSSDLDTAIHDGLKAAGAIPFVYFWPNLTASLDAALALVERVLPGCERVDVRYFPNFRYKGHAKVWPDGDLFFKADAATAALALILALLKALHSQTEGEADANPR